jgi:hypothetical protein
LTSSIGFKSAAGVASVTGLGDGVPQAVIKTAAKSMMIKRAADELRMSDLLESFWMGSYSAIK